MPLISDSTNIYVGNTEISKVYAGSAVVWERSLPSTDQVIINGLNGVGYAYAVWPYEFTDCGAVNNDWLFRNGWDVNNTGSPTSFQEWYKPSDAPGWWFYSPQHKKMCMGSSYSGSNDILRDIQWYQIYDNRKKQIILTLKVDKTSPVVTKPADAIDCIGPIPIDSQVQTQLPTDSTVRRTFITWPNTHSMTSCSSPQYNSYYVTTALSDDPEGLTQPIFWNKTIGLGRATYNGIWPTYNAVVWSPDEASSDQDTDTLKRLWVKVNYPISNGDYVVPPTRLNQNPEFYNYPSGDSIMC